MAETHAVPTAAERLGIKARARERRHDEPPRHPMFLVMSLCMVLLSGIAAKRLLGDDGHPVDALIVVLNLWTATQDLRLCWRRIVPGALQYAWGGVTVAVTAALLLSRGERRSRRLTHPTWWP